MSGVATGRGLAAALAALVLTLPVQAASGCDADAAAPSVHCGRTPTAVFDPAGRLWVAFEYEGQVYVVAADHPGAHFSTPVAVNADPEQIDVNGENRPKIAIGPSGAIHVSWTRKLPGGFNGEIRYSRSTDGGRTFEPARTINDDGLATGHRFETLLVDGRGDVYLAWIDKRDLVAATDRGEDYAGAAVYYAVSADGGVTFRPNRKVADHSCECCRIAAAESPAGDIALFYRAIFDTNVRDHAFAAVAADGVTRGMRRATHDDWRIDACPHHGPALLSAGRTAFDLAWFTNGSMRQGVYYGSFDAGTGGLNRIRAVSASPSAGHPSLARSPARLFLAWKEFTGETTDVLLIESQDDGVSWSGPVAIASTSGASDHPFLLAHGGRVFLSWHTGDEGLRIVAADAPREERGL